MGLGLNLDAPGSHFSSLQSIPPTIARTTLFAKILDPISSILPFRSRRRRDEGIIAPHTPAPIPPPSPSPSRRSSWNTNHPQFNAFQHEAGSRSPLSSLSNPPPPRRTTSEQAASSRPRSPLGMTASASASARVGSGSNRMSLGRRTGRSELDPDMYRSTSPDSMSDSAR